MLKNQALILSNDNNIISKLNLILIRNNYITNIHNKVYQALNFIKNNSTDIFFIENSNLEVDVIDISEWIKKNSQKTKIVLMNKIENNFDYFFNLDFESIILPIEEEKIINILDKKYLKGSLSNIYNVDIFEIIQIINLSNKTTIITIFDSINNEEGKIFFKKGNLIHCEFKNLFGKNAFLELFKIKGGIFYEIKYFEPVKFTIKSNLFDLLKQAILLRDSINFSNSHTLKHKNKLFSSKILIIDKNIISILSLKKILEENSFLVEFADTLLKGINLLKADTFDIVISDIDMPSLKGFDLLFCIKQVSPETKIILMGNKINFFNEINLENFFNENFVYIRKPFNIKKLVKFIKNSFFINNFSGQLLDISLINYLKIISISNKNIIINIINSENNKKGLIFIKNGKLIHVYYDKSQGEDAFLKILNIKNIIFSDKKYIEPGVISIKEDLKNLIFKYSITKTHNNTDNIPMKLFNNLSIKRLNKVEKFINQEKIIENISNEKDLVKKLTIFENEGIFLECIIGETSKNKFITIISKYSNLIENNNFESNTIIIADIDIIVSFNKNNVLEKIIFGRNFIGKTKRGLGINDNFKECIKYYGKPIVSTKKAVVYDNIGFYSIAGLYITSIELKSYFKDKVNNIKKTKLVKSNPNKIFKTNEVLQPKNIIYEYGKFLDLILKSSSKNDIIDKIRNKFNVLPEIKPNKLIYKSLSLTFELDSSNKIESIFIGDKIKSETEKGLKIGDKIEKAYSIYGNPQYKSENTFVWDNIILFTNKNDSVTRVRLK
ncbi:MAG: response regulator [Candidatus Sericytochromatia bacterium]